MTKKASVIAAAQMRTALNLKDGHLASNLDKSTKRKIYENAMNYDLFGLMNEMKEYENINNHH